MELLIVSDLAAFFPNFAEVAQLNGTTPLQVVREYYEYIARGVSVFIGDMYDSVSHAAYPGKNHTRTLLLIACILGVALS